MITIQIDVSEDIIQKLGKEAIKNYMHKQMNLLKLSVLGDEIRTAMEESNFDWEQELQLVKQESWEEYKSQYLSNILP
jgi:hypothetical protein